MRRWLGLVVLAWACAKPTPPRDAGVLELLERGAQAPVESAEALAGERARQREEREGERAAFAHALEVQAKVARRLVWPQVASWIAKSLGMRAATRVRDEVIPAVRQKECHYLGASDHDMPRDGEAQSCADVWRPRQVLRHFAITATIVNASAVPVACAISARPFDELARDERIRPRVEGLFSGGAVERRDEASTVVGPRGAEVPRVVALCELAFADAASLVGSSDEELGRIFPRSAPHQRKFVALRDPETRAWRVRVAAEGGDYSPEGDRP